MLTGTPHDRPLRVLLLCIIALSLRWVRQHASSVSCLFSWNTLSLELLILPGTLRCRLSPP